MIMKAPDEDDFFCRWLDGSTTAEQHEWVPPVDDWRFAPHQLGRHLRVDAAHTVQKHPPRLMNRKPGARRTIESSETLHFG